MFARAGCSIVGALSLIGCDPVTHSVEIDMPVSSLQKDLNAISDGCGSPREMLVADGEMVEFRPDPEMDYEAAACVLEAIKEAGITNFGFVANEKYSPIESTPIQVAQTADEAEDTMHARWNIEVYSGMGLPGSPGASVVVEDYMTVLQGIVDRCELGRTVLVQATDGVSILAIMNDDLSDDQIACIRKSERPGLSLKDWGTDG